MNVCAHAGSFVAPYKPCQAEFRVVQVRCDVRPGRCHIEESAECAATCSEAIRPDHFVFVLKTAIGARSEGIVCWASRAMCPERSVCVSQSMRLSFRASDLPIIRESK